MQNVEKLIGEKNICISKKQNQVCTNLRSCIRKICSVTNESTSLQIPFLSLTPKRKTLVWGGVCIGEKREGGRAIYTHTETKENSYVMRNMKMQLSNKLKKE